MMASVGRPEENCSVCGKPWSKHTQPEQDRCFREKSKNQKGGSGIW